MTIEAYLKKTGHELGRKLSPSELPIENKGGELSLRELQNEFIKRSR
jgi:hypothetical protein